MRLHRSLRNFLGLLWLGTFTTANTYYATAQLAAPSAPRTQKRLAWKVKSETAEVTLLGSIHLGTKGMFPLPTEIEDAFTNSGNLVVEIDINKVDQTSIMRIIQQSGMYQGNDTLWKHLKPATADAVKKFCKTYKFPENNLSKLKPWLAAITASIIPLQQAGMETELGIDKYFLDKAADKKNIIQLETADWQIKLLSTVPEKMQDEYLFESVKQAAKTKEMGSQIVKLWMSGDAAVFSTWVEKNMKMPGDMGRKLLEDRNHPMADAIEKLLKGNEKSFVVVGAAHMVGKEGIVALLKGKGYTVEQMELQVSVVKSGSN